MSAVRSGASLSSGGRIRRGCGWLVASTWWLYVSMHRYGGLAAPLAAAAVGLLCAALSLYLAAAMAWVARQRCGRPLADATRFAAGWLAAELARAVIFTGFPWNPIGSAAMPIPLLMQSVAVIGMPGMMARTPAAA